MTKFNRIAIANRGEVAVRIIKACEELGIESVLLHSEADIESRAYRMATKTICIGPAATAESYLNIKANINGAIAGGAQAIHPGFGFLSENADFAEEVARAGLIFIGPSPEAIRSYTASHLGVVSDAAVKRDPYFDSFLGMWKVPKRGDPLSDGGHPLSVGPR